MTMRNYVIDPLKARRDGLITRAVGWLDKSLESGTVSHGACNISTFVEARSFEKGKACRRFEDSDRCGNSGQSRRRSQGGAGESTRSPACEWCKHRAAPISIENEAGKNELTQHFFYSGYLIFLWDFDSFPLGIERNVNSFEIIKTLWQLSFQILIFLNRCVKL